MESFSDWLVSALGGSRYLEGAYSLRHDNVLLTMYVAEYLLLSVSIIGIAACLLSRQGQLTGVNRPAAALYGLTFLAIGAFALSNLLCLFVPVYRLDVVVGGAASILSAMTCGFTFTSLFGHTPEIHERRHA